MRNKVVLARRALYMAVIKVRNFVRTIDLTRQVLWLKQHLFYLLFVVFMFTFGYELGHERLEIRPVQVQLTKEERIQRIEAERAKRLSEKKNSDILESPSPEVTASSNPNAPTPSTSKVPTASPAPITATSAVAFSGMIESLNQQSLVVKNSKGEMKSFVITEKSAFVSKNGKSGSYSEFKVGDDVIIFGTIKEGKILLVRVKEM